MKKRTTIKTLAAAVVLGACAAGLHATTEDDQRLIVYGENDSELGTFDASEVSYLEFKQAVYPYARVDNEGNLLFKPSPDVSFKMIKVEGGVDYALTRTGSEITSWSPTKRIDNFYLGQYEVTQGVYKAMMTSVPDGQSATGNDYPVAMVSWNMIAGSGDNFLTAINAKLAEIKENNPAVATALGDREFRLPSEWEWEYAASGGKNYATLNYYFSGTSEETPEALETVAVNSVDPNKATSVAKVGSKLPNNLGLYVMSGNVWEWCSGLGYPADPDTPGYQVGTSTTLNSNRPARGGGWNSLNIINFWVLARGNNSVDITHERGGFRLAL